MDHDATASTSTEWHWQCPAPVLRLQVALAISGIQLELGAGGPTAAGQTDSKPEVKSTGIVSLSLIEIIEHLKFKLARAGLPVATRVGPGQTVGSNSTSRRAGQCRSLRLALPLTGILVFSSYSIAPGP